MVSNPIAWSGRPRATHVSSPCSSIPFAPHPVGAMVVGLILLRLGFVLVLGAPSGALVCTVAIIDRILFLFRYEESLRGAAVRQIIGRRPEGPAPARLRSMTSDR